MVDDRTIIEVIAREVMGWAVHFRNTAHYVLAYQEGKTYDRPQAIVGDWNPLAYGNDVLGVIAALIEKGQRIEIDASSCGTGARVWAGGEGLWRQDKSFSRAISLAVYEWAKERANADQQAGG